MKDPQAFIRANTAIARPPLVPEIALHLATRITPIWQATEDWLEKTGLAPPFWAFAWPGSQALARWALDGRERFAGRRVLDFASGSGLAAIACAMAGAVAEAIDIDPIAEAAARLNAALNDVAIAIGTADLTGETCRWDVILCGDVCYEAPMTAHVFPWLRCMARDADVYVADPGRAYLPAGLDPVAMFDVPTTLELEDRTVRRVAIYHVTPAAKPGR